MFDDTANFCDTSLPKVVWQYSNYDKFWNKIPNPNEFWLVQVSSTDPVTLFVNISPCLDKSALVARALGVSKEGEESNYGK